MSILRDLSSYIYLLQHLQSISEEKYTFLDTRTGYTPPQIVESSFKHYSDMTGENGPELINMTTGQSMGTSSSLMQPDGPYVDVTLQRNVNLGGSVATLNNGGGVATLPRSSLTKRGENHTHSHGHSHHGTLGHSHHGTLLKRSVDELRTSTASPAGAVIVTSASMGGATSVTPDHLHHHEPSRDTLRRVHFDKNTPGASSNGSNSTEVSASQMHSSIQGNLISAVTPPVPPAVPSHKIPITTSSMNPVSPPPTELVVTTKEERTKSSSSGVVRHPKDSSPSSKAISSDVEPSGPDGSPTNNTNNG